MHNSGSAPNASLSDTISADIRQRIVDGEWSAGETIDSENGLASHYGVSRATVRTALQDLESRGMTSTRHGLGTLVLAPGQKNRPDIRRLESISSTIAAEGREPKIKYRSITVRAATEAETELLKLDSSSEVLATERSIWADHELIGFSSEIIPMAVVGPGFDIGQVSGSLFDLLDRMGALAEVAITELGADHGPHIGWGERPDKASYLRLEQLHYDRNGGPVVASTTYFIDGQFNFGLIRHR